MYLMSASKRWVRFWSYPRDQCHHYSCGSFSICDPYLLLEFECECLPGYEPKVQSEWFLREGKDGCVRKSGEPTFGTNSANPGFVNLAGVKVPDTAYAVANKTMGLKECADLCLNNCSCTAYSNADIRNGGSGCIIWYGDLIDRRQFSNAGQNVYVKVSASELEGCVSLENFLCEICSKDSPHRSKLHCKTCRKPYFGRALIST